MHGQGDLCSHQSPLTLLIVYPTFWTWQCPWYFDFYDKWGGEYIVVLRILSIIFVLYLRRTPRKKVGTPESPVQLMVSNAFLYWINSQTFEPSVLLHRWLGVRKSMWPVKIEWWGIAVAVCLEWVADCLHMVQLMPLHPKLHHLVPHLNQKTFWYWLTVLEKIVPVVVLVVLAAAAAASYVS